jgi:hypothetical protein
LLKAVVLKELRVRKIVEAAAAEGSFGEVKAGRVDDMQPHPEAGAEAQHGAGILRDVGLVEGEFDGDFKVLLRRATQRGRV